MTDQEAAFVEAMGKFLSASGMTPMAGRMWAWLLICEPPEQTAGVLADELQASRGSISGAARLLASAGLIRRTTRRGDRREYFSAPPGTFAALVDGLGATYRHFRELTAQGLATMADRPAPSRERLQEIHDVYEIFESELPALLERFHERREHGRVTQPNPPIANPSDRKVEP
jgi:hypothetical protein